VDSKFTRDVSATRFIDEQLSAALFGERDRLALSLVQGARESIERGALRDPGSSNPCGLHNLGRARHVVLADDDLVVDGAGKLRVRR
jgi:hypothetical protein